MRILVVEDNADTRRVMVLFLQQLGHVVSTARGMHEGLETLSASPFDVLISDIGLPDGNGWDLLTSINNASSIYSIAMSGFGLNADRARSEAVGYRHHLIKPFDPDRLSGMLDQAARERGEDRALGSKGEAIN